MIKFMNILLLLLCCIPAFPDNPMPIALLATPGSGDTISGDIEIWGVAGQSSGNNFGSWALSWSVDNINWTNIASGTSSVGLPVTWSEPDEFNSIYGKFTDWNSATVGLSDIQIIIKLVVTDSGGITEYHVPCLASNGIMSANPLPSPHGPQGIPIKMNGTTLVKGMTVRYFAPPNTKTPVWKILKRSNNSVSDNYNKMSPGKDSNNNNYYVDITWTKPGSVNLFYTQSNGKKSEPLEVDIYEVIMSSHTNTKSGEVAPGTAGVLFNQWVLTATSGKEGSGIPIKCEVGVKLVNPDENYSYCNSVLTGYIQNVWRNRWEVHCDTVDNPNTPYNNILIHPQRGTTPILDYDISNHDRSFYSNNSTKIMSGPYENIITLEDKPTTAYVKWNDKGNTETETKQQGTQKGFISKELHGNMSASLFMVASLYKKWISYNDNIRPLDSETKYYIPVSVMNWSVNLDGYTTTSGNYDVLTSNNGVGEAISIDMDWINYNYLPNKLTGTPANTYYNTVGW